MGSVFIDRERGTWIAAYNQYDVHTGKKRRRWTRGFSNEDNARRYIKAKENTRNRIPINEFSTLKELCEYWLKNYVKTKSYHTIKSYTGLTKDIIKYFTQKEYRKKYIKDYEPQNIENFYTYFRENTKVTENTILHYHRVLHIIFGVVFKWGYMPVNLIDRVTAPRKTKFKEKHWKLDTMAKAIVYLKDNKFNKLELPFLIAAKTGMRRGEIVALQYEDIDFETGIVSITHSLYLDDDNKPTLKSPKSESGIRDLYFPFDILKKISKIRTLQKINKLKHGNEYYDSNFLFTDEKGLIMRPDYLTKTFRKFIIYYNLNPIIRFHDVRYPNLFKRSLIYMCFNQKRFGFYFFIV